MLHVVGVVCTRMVPVRRRLIKYLQILPLNNRTMFLPTNKQVYPFVISWKSLPADVDSSCSQDNSPTVAYCEWLLRPKYINGEPKPWNTKSPAKHHSWVSKQRLFNIAFISANHILKNASISEPWDTIGAMMTVCDWLRVATVSEVIKMNRTSSHSQNAFRPKYLQSGNSEVKFHVVCVREKITRQHLMALLRS